MMFVTSRGYRWAAPGDVNAFFGLMLDNVAGLVLTVSLLKEAFGFPEDFALRYMVPGTAVGVLLGDLIFFFMALGLARRTGRDDVTAMPLGLDTPSTFGMILFVLGPAFLVARNSGLDEQAAAAHAWRIGICAIVTSGIFKLACSLAANQARRLIPRAGLLGSLAAVALVLISFMPLLEIFHQPVVGLVSLAIILTTLVARIELPGRIPGALAALLVGTAVYYLLVFLGLAEASPPPISPRAGLLPTEWFASPRGDWVSAFGDSLRYLPVVIPFALATVIGGIDCTESAAASGDEFPTGQVIAAEGLATLVAGLCGGVIQTTPYIGHPAYKAMGGRAAYVLATALFIGAAGLLGFFGFIYVVIIKATIFPILVFIGLEITAQSFHATPKRHYSAVAIACVPALASLAMIFVDGLLATLAATYDAHSLWSPDNPGHLIINELGPPLDEQVQTLRVLSAGFIVTSLLWATAMAHIVDRRLNIASLALFVAAGCSLFGIIHSPLPGNPLVLPWSELAVPDVAAPQTPAFLAAAYGLMSLTLWGLHWGLGKSGPRVPGPMNED
jgi:AGZA family xanthine/uracil permease-like MFS transporter